MRKKFLITLFTATVSLVLMSSLILNTYAASQRDIDELNDKKSQAEDELNSVNAQMDTAESELESLKSQVAEVESELARLNTQLDDLNNSIDTKEAEIKQEEAEIEEKDDLLKQRMVAFYELGDTSYLDLLFNSADLFDFLSTYSIVQQIVEADTALINELEEKKAQLEEDKAELESNRAEVQTVKAEQEKKSTELQSLQAEKEQVINSLSEDQKALEQQIQAFEDAIDEAQEEIRRQEEANNATNGKYEGSFEGVLEWPLSYNYNIITSIFGNRTAPTAGASTNHGAIDIGVSYVPVYAPASGKVILAGYVSGYGNYIKIDHGNGYYTAFGHLSAFNVRAGDVVSTGEQIAVSGNTGVSTGPHLHYEVYIGGSSKGYRVDPLQYTSHPSLIYH